MSNYCSSYATQIIYCALFGATSGAYIGLTPVIIIDLIGLDNFIQVYGFQLFSIGIGRLIGPPLIGKFKYTTKTKHHEFNHLSGALHDASGNHYSGFYLAGSSMIISGLLLLLIPWIEHMKQKRKCEREPLIHAKSTTEMMRSVHALHSALEWQLGLPPSEEMASL